MVFLLGKYLDIVKESAMTEREKTWFLGKPQKGKEWDEWFAF